MRVTRIYTGDDGQSHFEELDVPLGPGSDRLSHLVPLTGVLFRHTRSGSNLDYHPAPRRQFVVTLTGRVEVGDLPGIDADPTQVRQLMQNLIGNSLKYQRPDVPPVVKVTGRRVDADPTGAAAACLLLHALGLAAHLAVRRVRDPALFLLGGEVGAPAGMAGLRSRRAAGAAIP